MIYLLNENDKKKQLQINEVRSGGTVKVLHSKYFRTLTPKQNRGRGFYNLFGYLLTYSLGRWGLERDFINEYGP